MVILENHPLVLDQIMAQMNAASLAIDVLYAGDSPAAALATVDRSSPPIALVDLDLGDNIEIADVVRGLRSANVPVVLMSAAVSPAAVQRGLAAGAAAFVHKRSLTHDLPRIIASVEQGIPWMSPDFAACLVPAEGQPSRVEPMTVRALTLFAGGLPLNVIAARLALPDDEVRRLLVGAPAHYRDNP